MHIKTVVVAKVNSMGHVIELSLRIVFVSFAITGQKYHKTEINVDVLGFYIAGRWCNILDYQLCCYVKTTESALYIVCLSKFRIYKFDESPGFCLKSRSIHMLKNARQWTKVYSNGQFISA